MAFYECYLLPADLIDFPIGAILHENQSLGGMLLLQEPQQCIGLLVQWTSWNIICCAAKAFGKIGA